MKILIVDDDKNIRRTLTATLTSLGHEVAAAATVDEALQALNITAYDFMLIDFKLEDKSGIDLLKAVQQTISPPITAIMTAHASFENAVTAVKEGAFDYLPKPFSNSQLDHLLKRISVIVSLRQENERLRKSSSRPDFFFGQTSPAMEHLKEFVRKIAPIDATVLLIGESGTGKTELARLIHSSSTRASEPFGVVNCASLAENLLESEIFGHMKGSFTGASQMHVGKLEQANFGTVLFDEIGELSLTSQAKLLRFLQEKVIERVGGNVPVTLDIRVIAATNRNLEEAVAEGKFREDLYFRLNIFECELVPLRHRKEDIPVLIQTLLKEIQISLGHFEIKTIPENVMALLLNYSWPGNIRELRNVLERLLILSQGTEMKPEHLPESVREGIQRRLPGDTPGSMKSLEEIERDHIAKVLAYESNQEKAAKILGITTVTLWRKRKQLGLA